MTFVPYLVGGYGITAGAVVLYTWRVLARGRSLARAVPPEERPWR